MPKIELNKIYNSSQITEYNNKWTDFEGFQGSEVELFLKDKLEDSVVNFEYYNTDFTTPDTNETLNNVLVGKNSFGKIVCYTRVINVDPTYSSSFNYNKITIGSKEYFESDSYIESIQINKSDNLKAYVSFNFSVIGNVAGSEFNENSNQTLTFGWFNDNNTQDQSLISITHSIKPGDNVNIDISKMFEDSFVDKRLGISYQLKNSNGEYQTYTEIFKHKFTLRKLELSYSGSFIIPNNILSGFKLDGTLNESLDSYNLEYHLDVVKNPPYYFSLSGQQDNNIKIELNNLSEGIHSIFVRAYKNNLYSNYIQINFIYQKDSDSVLQNALAVISEIPDEIQNCNLSKFFKVITTSKLSGEIEIVALKSDNVSNIISINSIEDAKKSNYLFKEIKLSLLNTDESKIINYTSYIETPGTDDSEQYIKIIIKQGNKEEILKHYVIKNNSPAQDIYKPIKIINPDEGSEHLQYTKGEILNFSQISNGNFFENLNSDLDVSDGLQLETIQDETMTMFKVSPVEKVFDTPKKLLSGSNIALHKTNGFSIEMLFKTYGVNDLEDKIMTIGNITLCPKHLFINYNPSSNTEPHHIVNASRADFRKENLQHITITYDSQYKPNTYEILYDKFFNLNNVSYSNNAESFPCLKIYVNGVINRIISVGEGVISSDNDFKLQIHPSNSNINFYIFRTYDKCLNYEEIQKNYISSMLHLVDKQKYYKENDIVYKSSDFKANEISNKLNILNTISLGKCINKFKSISNPNKQYIDKKVLLLALPEGKLPPFYGNRKEDSPKATFLIHYPEINGNPSDYSGRLSGGKVKSQGSSAKKYMFHNTSYSKFTFTPESQFKEESPITHDYYKMPTSELKIEKLVGKVNYASSMQSHKQGATKLFHEAYVSSTLNMSTDWMNNGRKAVLEDEFLYFFVNVPEDQLNTLTWDYFKQEDGTYNFENCYFLGFQTWGSAKGDKETSGYSEATPDYLMLEGADNDNSVANFKTPWASMQIWGNYNNGVWTSANSTIIQPPGNYSNNNNYYHQFSGKNEEGPDYLTGLLIKDETIVFDPGTESGTSSDKRADAWDVDFGCIEGANYNEDDNLFFVFKDSVKNNVKRFAEFYNLIYTFDFSSLLFIEPGTEINGNSSSINEKESYHNKLVFGANCTIKYNDGTIIKPKSGDIYRWEKAWPEIIVSNSSSKWVPAGLYHNGNTWESLNVADICTNYSKAADKNYSINDYPKEYSFFKKDEYDSLKAVDGSSYKYIITNGYTFEGYNEEDLYVIQECMAEAFKIVCNEYLDINDVSYHQAFIKLVAGTDNRAKNTYFQIVGPIYTNKATLSNGTEVDIVKIEEGDYKDEFGYINDGQFYKVNIIDDTIIETEDIYNIDNVKTKPYYYKPSGKGDNKIRLYQDDLDTIFKTDNNGQQIKPYYLLEPPYDKNLEYLWGDLHSGFFYNYDLVFTKEIKSKLSSLLNFSTGNQWPDSENTKFNEYFFKIQKNLPAISYNHQSEIYYESVQTLWKDGNPTQFYNLFTSNESWKDFNNNKVYNPISLSHGNCLESEIEYLRDRVLFLSTYTQTAKNTTGEFIKLSGGSSTTQGQSGKISSKYTSFIQYIYPFIVDDKTNVINQNYLQYDTLLDRMIWEGNNYQKVDLIYKMAIPDKELEISNEFSTSNLTNESKWNNVDLFKTIWINEGTKYFTDLFNFPNASTVISQDPDYKIESIENKEINVVNYLESVEHLVLQNAQIQSIGLNFIGCNRLKTLILGTTENSLSEEDDEGNISYYAVQLEDVLNSSKNIKLTSGEGSVGFKQVILPKSNNVEYVVLPNCIETINIGYYPNLKKLEFNDGTKLNNLTIDGRNKRTYIEYIINNFVTNNTINLEITNIPDNFWLSENTCRNLIKSKNVKLSGTINIGDGTNLTDIDWTTKRMLVEKLGDITKGDLVFKYKESDVIINSISVNPTGSIESSGPAPINLSITGNRIPIIRFDNKYYLNIQYSILDENGQSVDSSKIKFTNKYYPYLEIKDGLKGTYKIKTIVTSSSSKILETTITVGFYVPKIGDFAYANGSFSSVYDNNLGLIGIVFNNSEYTNESGNTVYDVRVLSSEYSSTDVPLGPADYAVNNNNYYNESLINYQKTYKDILDNLSLGSEEYIKDVTIRTNSSGTLYYDTPINNLSDKQELSYQKEYLKRANEYISKLSLYNQLGSTYIENNYNNITDVGKNNFKNILELLNNKPSINVNNQSYTTAQCGSFLYALYPAFLKALYYEPSVELSGKGKEFFGLGKWYVPNSLELSNIIIYRINSSIINNSNTEHNWNSTNSSDQTFNEELNVFSQDAFNNIKFLQDTQEQISSECDYDGNGLTYCEYYSGNQYVPGWKQGIDNYWENHCGRDMNHNISPVCRIELIAPK